MKIRPLPFTVYGQRWKMLLLLLLGLAFTAGGVWMIRDGAMAGWFVAGFFALCIPVSVIQLIRPARLTVDAEGIEFSALHRVHRLRWMDLSEFGTYTIRSGGMAVRKMVGFNYSPEFEGMEKRRSVSKLLAGFEAGLPDTYGYRAEELAELLSYYHRQWSSR